MFKHMCVSDIICQTKVYRQSDRGLTCSVVRLAKLLVRFHLLSLKMDHPKVLLVMGELHGPSDQYGSFSQRYQYN